MDLRRAARHLMALPGSVARAFPAAAQAAIESAIRDGEAQHGAQVRFAVEAALDPAALRLGESARERAIEVFAELRVWDTERNNGVLLYLLLAERDVEIVADRGFNGKVAPQEWERLCEQMEGALGSGRYEAAVCGALRAIAALAARHFPPRAGAPNELADRPALL